MAQSVDTSAGPRGTSDIVRNLMETSAEIMQILGSGASQTATDIVETAKNVIRRHDNESTHDPDPLKSSSNPGEHPVSNNNVSDSIRNETEINDCIRNGTDISNHLPDDVSSEETPPFSMRLTDVTSHAVKASDDKILDSGGETRNSDSGISNLVISIKNVPNATDTSDETTDHNLSTSFEEIHELTCDINPAPTCTERCQTEPLDDVLLLSIHSPAPADRPEDRHQEPSSEEISQPSGPERALIFHDEESLAQSMDSPLGLVLETSDSEDGDHHQRVPFPVTNVVPPAIEKKMRLHCQSQGTSVQMLLAALLPATACALGTGTSVRTRNFGDDRLSVASLYSIAGAGPGSGKSVAFRMGLHKPMTSVEQQNEKEWLIKNEEDPLMTSEKATVDTDSAASTEGVQSPNTTAQPPAKAEGENSSTTTASTNTEGVKSSTTTAQPPSKAEGENSSTTTALTNTQGLKSSTTTAQPPSKAEGENSSTTTALTNTEGAKSSTTSSQSIVTAPINAEGGTASTTISQPASDTEGGTASTTISQPASNTEWGTASTTTSQPAINIEGGTASTTTSQAPSTEGEYPPAAASGSTGDMHASSTPSQDSSPCLNTSKLSTRLDDLLGSICSRSKSVTPPLQEELGPRKNPGSDTQKSDSQSQEPETTDISVTIDSRKTQTQNLQTIDPKDSSQPDKASCGPVLSLCSPPDSPSSTDSNALEMDFSSDSLPQISEVFSTMSSQHLQELHETGSVQRVLPPGERSQVKKVTPGEHVTKSSIDASTIITICPDPTTDMSDIRSGSKRREISSFGIGYSAANPIILDNYVEPPVVIKEETPEPIPSTAKSLLSTIMSQTGKNSVVNPKPGQSASFTQSIARSTSLTQSPLSIARNNLITTLGSKTRAGRPPLNSNQFQRFVVPQSTSNSAHSILIPAHLVPKGGLGNFVQVQQSGGATRPFKVITSANPSSTKQNIVFQPKAAQSATPKVTQNVSIQKPSINIPMPVRALNEPVKIVQKPVISSPVINTTQKTVNKANLKITLPVLDKDGKGQSMTFTLEQLAQAVSTNITGQTPSLVNVSLGAITTGTKLINSGATMVQPGTKVVTPGSKIIKSGPTIIGTKLINNGPTIVMPNAINKNSGVTVVTPGTRIISSLNSGVTTLTRSAVGAVPIVSPKVNTGAKSSSSAESATPQTTASKQDISIECDYDRFIKKLEGEKKELVYIAPLPQSELKISPEHLIRYKCDGCSSVFRHKKSLSDHLMRRTMSLRYNCQMQASANFHFLFYNTCQLNKHCGTYAKESNWREKVVISKLPDSALGDRLEQFEEIKTKKYKEAGRSYKPQAGLKKTQEPSKSASTEPPADADISSHGNKRLGSPSDENSAKSVLDNICVEGPEKNNPSQEAQSQAWHGKFVTESSTPAVVNTSRDNLPVLCVECGHSFRSVGLLQTHFLAAQSKKFFHCKTCPVTLRSECSYKAHLRIHRGQKPYVCPECGQVIHGTHRVFWKHLHVKCAHHIRQFTFDCPKCGNEQSSNQSYVSHILKNHCEEYFKCVRCPMAFRNQKSFQSHSTAKHGSDFTCFRKISKCPLCDAVFNDTDKLSGHITNNHLDKLPIKYRCNACNQKFSGRNACISHMEKQHKFYFIHGEMCHYCGKEFKTAIPLYSHLQREHGRCRKEDEELTDFLKRTGALKMTQVTKGSMFDSTPKKVSATVPGVAEDNSSETLTASRSSSPCDVVTLGIKQEQLESDVVPLKCNRCQKEFTEAAAYQRHLAKHRFIKRKRLSTDGTDLVLKIKIPKVEDEIKKALKEDEAPKVFTKQFPLAPEPEPRHLCPECGTGFYVETDLNNHMKQEHDLNRQFPCHLCGKTYVDHSLLKDHVRRRHAGYIKPKPFACWLCKENDVIKEFQHSTMLTKHLASIHKIKRDQIDFSKYPKVEDQADNTKSRALSECGSTTCSLDGAEEDDQGGDPKKRPIVVDRAEDVPAVKRLKLQGESLFSCAKCVYTSDDRSKFIDHISEHRTKWTHGLNQCLECGLSFTSIPSLKKHLFVVHKIRNFETYQQESGVDLVSQPTEIEIPLPKRVADPNPHKIHRVGCRSEPVITKKPKPSEEIPGAWGWECNVCYKHFDSEADLKVHMRTHGMAYIRSKRFDSSQGQ